MKSNKERKTKKAEKQMDYIQRGKWMSVFAVDILFIRNDIHPQGVSMCVCACRGESNITLTPTI
jgi:hypothetical protein